MESGVKYTNGDFHGINDAIAPDRKKDVKRSNRLLISDLFEAESIKEFELYGNIGTTIERLDFKDWGGRLETEYDRPLSGSNLESIYVSDMGGPFINPSLEFHFEGLYNLKEVYINTSEHIDEIIIMRCPNIENFILECDMDRLGGVTLDVKTYYSACNLETKNIIEQADSLEIIY